MGILDRIMFWKKSDSLDLGADFSQPSMTGLGSDNMGMPQSSLPDFGRYPAQQTFDDTQFGHNPQFSIRDLPRQEPFSPQNYAAEKNMELISSKLDALKAGLDSISQRLANIERMAQSEHERDIQKRRNYW